MTSAIALTLALPAVAFGASPAQATDGQSAQPAAATPVVESAPQDAAEVVNPDIIVTAEKRAESLHTIPIAISSLSGEVLEKSGVENIRDLQRMSPSLQVGQDVGQTFISIRGIGAEVTNIGGEPAVAVSQDGVVLSRQQLMDIDFLDIDRVEILRGPQGTISGRNATGGAMNIYSKEPTSTFEAGISATVGNYKRFQSEGFISGPILGTGILGRLAFKTDNADGWLRNTFLDESLAGRAKAHARASFLAEPASGLEVKLILDGIRDRSTPQPPLPIGRARADTPTLAEFAGVPGPDLEELRFEADQQSEFSRDQYSATLSVRLELNEDATLTSTTGYVDADLYQINDCDATRLAYCAFPWSPGNPRGVEYDIWEVTQELTLTADLTETLDLILGGLYLQDEAKEPVQFASPISRSPVPHRTSTHCTVSG